VQRGFEAGATDVGDHRIGSPRLPVAVEHLRHRGPVPDGTQVEDETFTDRGQLGIPVARGSVVGHHVGVVARRTNIAR